MLTGHSQIARSLHHFDATGLSHVNPNISALENHTMREPILDLRAKDGENMFAALEYLLYQLVAHSIASCIKICQRAKIMTTTRPKLMHQEENVFLWH